MAKWTEEELVENLINGNIEWVKSHINTKIQLAQVALYLLKNYRDDHDILETLLLLMIHAKL